MATVAQTHHAHNHGPDQAGRTGHAIADVTGYEDPETMAWDTACLEALAHLTAKPHGQLATAEASRLARGLDIARAGGVDSVSDRITVTGATGVYTWETPQGRCPCPDAKRYSQVQCKHMLAARIHAEALKGTPQESPEGLASEDLPTAAALNRGELATLPCTEAMFSLNLKLHVFGKEGQITVRGMSIDQFTQNLNAVKDLLASLDVEAAHPIEASPAPEAHYCTMHGPMKPSTKKPGTFFCPGKLADGSYCKSRWPVQ